MRHYYFATVWKTAFSYAKVSVTLALEDCKTYLILHAERIYSIRAFRTRQTSALRRQFSAAFGLAISLKFLLIDTRSVWAPGLRMFSSWKQIYFWHFETRSRLVGYTSISSLNAVVFGVRSLIVTVDSNWFFRTQVFIQKERCSLRKNCFYQISWAKCSCRNYVVRKLWEAEKRNWF